MKYKNVDVIEAENSMVVNQSREEERQIYQCVLK
jgi:hypothetical protein